MNILFLTPRLPYPSDTGAKIRTWNLLLQAKKTGHNVILLSFVYDKEDVKGIEIIKKEGIKVFIVDGKDKISVITILRALALNLPLTVAKYSGKKMRVMLREMMKNEGIDIVHLDHIHMSQYADCCNGTPTVIDEHNVESVILRRYAEREASFLKKLILRSEYKKMAKFEKTQCFKASKIFVVSENDRNNLTKICGTGINPEIIPNGVDTDYFTPPYAPHPAPFSIVFTGSLDWFPNEDGLIYFFTEIYPFIKEKIPRVNITIVGKSPSKRLLQFARNDNSVNFTGRVDDIRPFIANAKVFVVPLRIGGGTRLKILEAMAIGLPVVSTSIGAEGLEANNNEQLLIADTPDEFVEKVISVMEDEELEIRLGNEGRRFVEEKYDWKIVGNKLNETYREVVNNVK